MELEVNAVVETFEQAKELLADLEVPCEKYDIAFSINKNNYLVTLAGLSTDETVSKTVL
ncbi:TPA: hypothetical protein IX265_000277 [Enterococcus faecium]|nr:hypothetical protein [Enterococcus faecium]